MAVVQANNLLEAQSQLESGCLSFNESEFASEHQSMSEELIRKAFHATEESYTSIIRKQWPIQITTCRSRVLLLGWSDMHGNLYIANLGDSCAVLGTLVKPRGEVLAIQLSAEHNTCIEYEDESCILFTQMIGR
nr:PREDICTED: probable protein phosphatase 2C 28 [Daucus carota subsp. sativus]